MSIRLMTMVFDRYPGGGSEMLLALAMADHARDDGTSIWPSVAELARKTRQSERSVQRQIARMVTDGWLQLVRAASGRPGGTNQYRVNPAWMAGEDLPRQTGDKVTPVEPSRERETGDNLAPVSAVEVVHTGDKLAPVPASKVIHTGDTGGETGDTGDARGDTAMSPESSRTIKNHPPLPPGGGTTGFDEVFSEYPNQQNRAKAERRWERIAPAAELRQTMLRAISRLKLSKKWQRDGGRFVPEFVTWLRNAGWQDADAIEQAELAAWDASRSSILATAQRLGLPSWDEPAFNAGRGENFIAYTARVRAAVQGRGAACTSS